MRVVAMDAWDSVLCQSSAAALVAAVGDHLSAALVAATVATPATDFLHLPVADASLDLLVLPSVELTPATHVDTDSPARRAAKVRLLVEEAFRVLRPGGVFLFTLGHELVHPALCPCRAGREADGWLAALDAAGFDAVAKLRAACCTWHVGAPTDAWTARRPAVGEREASRAAAARVAAVVEAAATATAAGFSVPPIAALPDFSDVATAEAADAVATAAAGDGTADAYGGDTHAHHTEGEESEAAALLLATRHDAPLPAMSLFDAPPLPVDVVHAAASPRQAALDPAVRGAITRSVAALLAHAPAYQLERVPWFPAGVEWRVRDACVVVAWGAWVGSLAVVTTNFQALAVPTYVHWSGSAAYLALSSVIYGPVVAYVVGWDLTRFTLGSHEAAAAVHRLAVTSPRLNRAPPHPLTPGDAYDAVDGDSGGFYSTAPPTAAAPLPSRTHRVAPRAVCVRFGRSIATGAVLLLVFQLALWLPSFLLQYASVRSGLWLPAGAMVVGTIGAAVGIAILSVGVWALWGRLVAARAVAAAAQREALEERLGGAAAVTPQDDLDAMDAFSRVPRAPSPAAPAIASLHIDVDSPLL